MNVMTITHRFRLLFAIPLIWVTLVAGMSVVFQYSESRSRKTIDDATSYSPQVMTKLVTLLSQSLDAFENYVSTEKIIRQDETVNTQLISTALLNNFSIQTEKKFQDINNILTVLPNTLSSAAEKSRYESIVRIYQETFRPQLFISSMGSPQPKTEDLSGRLDKANIGYQAILKDIDGLSNLKVFNAEVRQTQYQTSLDSYENMLWGTIISLMVMIVLISWLGIDIKNILRKILGATPEEVNRLVDQIFKSRLGVDVLSEVALPKNVKTALIVFPETLMLLFSDIKKIHHTILNGDHQARFNLREHHPESRETLGLINDMLNHVGRPSVDLKVPVLNTATVIPVHTTNPRTSLIEDELQQSVDEAHEKIAKAEETLNQARSLGEDIAQSFHVFHKTHEVQLKLNQSQHAELQYAGEQTLALLEFMQTIPNRLMDGVKVCDALISRTLEEQKQLSTIENEISLVQKNTQQVSAQLSILENIALQGDMLSFNIAIEVARLGDEGRGFSAIGSEVRHLAERAMAQTHSIRALISDTDSHVISAHESLSQATIENNELLGHTQRINALTQSSAEATHTSVQSLSELAIMHEQLEGHSYEQFLHAHHQAVESNKLSQLMGTFLASVDSSDKYQTSLNQILPLTAVIDAEVFESIPLVTAISASSLSSEKTTENNKPAVPNKPLADNDWSLF